MIITPDTNEAASKLKSETSAGPSSEPSDPPPVYSPADARSDPTATQAQAPRALPDIKPCNFVSLSRPNAGISGKWIIEPALYIPPALLPPLKANETEETRKNLSLASHNGSIDAEIFLMPSNIEVVNEKKRIFMETSSRNGSVTMKVHEVHLPNTNKTRLPMTIFSYSANGRVTLHLPRSFQGPIIIKRLNGSIRLSSDVQASVTPLSDMDHTQRSFLGHFDPANWAHDAKWAGDELHIESTNGNVNINFDDEVEPAAKPKSAGFFARIFPF